MNKHNLYLQDLFIYSLVNYLYYYSYYDRIERKAKMNENYNESNDLESIPPYYKFNPRINNLIIKQEREELKPEYFFQKQKFYQVKKTHSLQIK